MKKLFTNLSTHHKNSVCREWHLHNSIDLAGINFLLDWVQRKNIHYALKKNSKTCIGAYCLN